MRSPVQHEQQRALGLQDVPGLHQAGDPMSRLSLAARYALLWSAGIGGFAGVVFAVVGGAR